MVRVGLLGRLVGGFKDMVSASCDLGLFFPMSGRPISPMAEGDVELGEPTVSPVIVRGIEAGHVRMDENTDVRTRSSSEFGGVNPMARGTPPTVRGKVVQAASDDVDDDLPQATPVLVAMRSFNHQHSLSEIHAHVQARHAARILVDLARRALHTRSIRILVLLNGHT